MTAERDLPADWVVDREETTHDGLMGRDYTAVRYRQEGTGRAVYLNEVIDGEDVWKYAVHHSGSDGELGTAADLDAAKELAFAFMREADDSE